MSNSAPPPGPQRPEYPQAPAYGQPAYGGSPQYQGYAPPGYGPPGGPGGPPLLPPYQQPHRRRRGLTILIVTVVLAIVAAGGAFAFYKADPFHLFTSGPQAAEALPANSLVYVGVDADPSAKQKIEALRFLNHFPAFRENSGITNEDADIRSSFFTKIIEAANCTDVSYADTVEPWLGKKFGLALVPAVSADSDPAVVVALAVSDEGKAKSGLSDLQACGEQTLGSGFGYAFEGDYVLLAQTQDLADTYAKAAQSSSLADNDDFINDMDSIGDLGVATLWVNVQGAIDAYGDTAAANGLTPADLGTLTSTYQRAAATFRFSSDHAEIAASVFGGTTDISHKDNQIGDLPDTTVFAASESGGAERLRASWDDIKTALSSDGVDVDQQLGQFEAQTGLVLPDDLETILGDNLMFSLDSTGLTSESLQAGDPSLFNAGVRFTSDPDELNAIYDKISSLVEAQTGQSFSLSKVESSDGLSIATNDSYANTLADLNGNLADSDAFKSVISDPSSKEFVLFFNWDAVESQIVDAVQNSADSTMTPSIIENLQALRAIGMTVETDGNYTVTTMDISVND